jgi:hypothetical protein
MDRQKFGVQRIAGRSRFLSLRLGKKDFENPLISLDKVSETITPGLYKNIIGKNGAVFKIPTGNKKRA